MSSKARFDGELMIDCRVEGLKAEVARAAGLPQIRDGTVYHCRTTTCCHCATVYLVNELRTRPREYCRTCDEYLCDPCARTAAQPGYVHRSFAELADLVRSGRYTLSGSTSAPLLIPVLKER